MGHFMALCLMKRLQMAGNRPIALMGGGTGYDRRPLRPHRYAQDDDRRRPSSTTATASRSQMERFIDFGEGKAIMVNNADWLLKLNYIDLLREVGACFSVNNMLPGRVLQAAHGKGPELPGVQLHDHAEL